ncbi:MAG: VCBS repeat-containing protein, partial [Verrucomicrobia bacterium]|nr:VCBS repeat-containing protein [Verrucomicrobiota bacterium]
MAMKHVDESSPLDGVLEQRLRFLCPALVCWAAIAGGSVGLCVDWQSVPGASGQRQARLQTPPGGLSPGFSTLDPALTGLAFTNRLAASRSLTNHILMNGSGVALGDINDDGLPDVYLCGLDGPNALFLNQGNWRFENIAAAAGVECQGFDSAGAALADLDGDKDLDLLVASVGSGARYFENMGSQRFVDRTAQSGLGSTSGAMGFAMADYDSDGDLDV